MATANLNIVQMLTTRMQYDGERQKILSENVASQGIPGYKAKDLVPLNFANVLASQVKKVEVKLTDSKHLSGAKPYTGHFLSQNSANSFEVKATGNNVATEEEMMKVAQNAADYQLSTNLYKKIGGLYKIALGAQGS